MKTEKIKSKETKNIRLTLMKNIFNDGDFNFSVLAFSKKHNIETGSIVFDTKRKALNYFNKH